ncbi:MAG: bifunctional proline dehydrogenase/L-glutamate gamma-semialdehyde dehydrogenase PutA [Hyphomicrobiaceae bacterium]
MGLRKTANHESDADVVDLGTDGAEAETAMRVDIGPSYDEIHSYHLMDERRLVGALMERAVYSEDERRRTSEVASQLVHGARASRTQYPGVDALIREYDLSSEEGVLLMCIAESLLRIPDTETADKLVSEKLAEGAWASHLGSSENLFVNASTWGFMMSGGLARLAEGGDDGGDTALAGMKRMIARTGEPVVRRAVRHAVRLLGRQFVAGRTIHDALASNVKDQHSDIRFSYDMLGEAAQSSADAEKYFERYMAAVEAVGRASGPDFSAHPDTLMARAGLSIKLSALHPRFEPSKTQRLHDELVPRLLTLARAARANGVAITFDAEEQANLTPLLSCFADVFLDESLEGWSGLGIAVQAYGKRTIPTLRWLRRLSREGKQRIPVRLVKGAYWDSEIKWAQERGLKHYPVFTNKRHTDISYLAAARLILSDAEAFYPQFATHNAHTLAAVTIAAGNSPHECQRLFGMGEALYAAARASSQFASPVRVYAPVGGHQDLLPYLVRRLLENGANSSFVHRVQNEDIPVSELIADPIAQTEKELTGEAALDATDIAKPREIYLPDRITSSGSAWENTQVRTSLLDGMKTALATEFEVGSIVDGEAVINAPSAHLVICPHDTQRRMGRATWAGASDIERAVEAATAAAHKWDRHPIADRADILDHAADLIQRDHVQLMAVIVREAGKTLHGAEADVREAVDFLRYYANEGRRLFSDPQHFNSPTGETNNLQLRARGPVACISPWNFPLAVYVGQIAAALVAGNPVLAKPAEQTPITAFLVTQLLHEAGVPTDVLHLIMGDGRVGAGLVRDRRVAGVAFTGGNEAAWDIQRMLAERRSAIVPFIAETGGINAMIADSSALTEQVVADAVQSAFDGAGQRCSAARVLFVQSDVADRTIDMLAGATEALDIGDPLDYATDIGPVINEAAQDRLESHKLKMSATAREVLDKPIPVACRSGTYVSPAIFELERLDQLGAETFGPILHVIRFERESLDKVISAVNATGYGLTLGLHSRINAVANYVGEHARVGNLYINRNQIGAVVGVQPFGGEGLSGTGPKAGGPNYVARFAVERVRTENITAKGGNIALLRSETQSDETAAD